jgi:hypothetical protein
VWSDLPDIVDLVIALGICAVAGVVLVFGPRQPETLPRCTCSDDHAAGARGSHGPDPACPIDGWAEA